MRSNLLALLTGFLTCVSALLIVGALLLFKDYREHVHDMSQQLAQANEQIDLCREALLATDKDVSRIEGIESGNRETLAEIKRRLEPIEKRLLELSRMDALRAMKGSN